MLPAPTERRAASPTTAGSGWAVAHPLAGLSPLQAALLRLTFAKTAHEQLGRDSCAVVDLGVDVMAAVGLLVVESVKLPPPQTFEKGATDADVQGFIATNGPGSGGSARGGVPWRPSPFYPQHLWF